MTISAQVIADSVNPQGNRLSSIEVCLPRFILAKFNTHRVFSRNFRSSRAVPVAKLIEEVRTNPFEPVIWLKNKPGMQGGELMTLSEIDVARTNWQSAARDAADHAEILAKSGVHKQWANRGLEPYLYVHGIVTSTEWSNFFALRDHSAAQPEIQVLARAMWRAMAASYPKLLQPGEWHLPYVTTEDQTLAASICHDEGLELLRKISVARCASVSYKTVDGKEMTFARAIDLHDKLLAQVPLHASPAEHQATPDIQIGDICWSRSDLHGNLHGWQQYRKMLPGECQ